ncbi:TPA: phage tail termination protein [Proteus mirabilis]
MIHEKFERYLNRGNLLDGFIVQYLTWNEQPDEKTQKYAVIQPDDGSGRFADLGADDFVTLVLVSAQYDPEPALIRANEILNFVAEFPDDCELNSIYNLGGLPRPIPTEEGRFILKLSFRCTS